MLCCLLRASYQGVQALVNEERDPSPGLLDARDHARTLVDEHGKLCLVRYMGWNDQFVVA
eukprot:XP_001705704.1 Hypothetical protein GL50803_123810 [Giardia lamblia ATCC 50803]